MTRRVAILGLGGRGCAWADAFHRAGWQVTGFDPDPSATTSILSRETTISGTVRGADWVAICLPDRLELMQKVIQRAQAEAPREAVIAVVSPAHDIDDIQSCALRPGTVVRTEASEAGGFTLDVSVRTTPEARATAEATLAELAAISSLDVPDLPVDQPPDAESA